MKIYLSVIVPVYNVENHLRKCLDSIINQTFKDLEIILVNDGSTDGSATICEEYGEKDPRIKVIHQPNSGVSAARNKGIEVATRNYLTFVDSDDWVENTMYEEMLKIAFQQPKTDVLMCDFRNVSVASTQEISAEIRAGHYSKHEIVANLYPTLLATENFGRIPIVSVCTCIFNRSLLLESKILFDPKLRYSEDYLFMAKVMIKAQSFHYFKRNYFYNYLQYDASRSKKFQPVWWENLLYLNRELRKLLQHNKEYNFTRQLKLQMVHSALFVLNNICKNDAMNHQEKLEAAKVILNAPDLEDAFLNLSFKTQAITQRFLLFFIKHKMPFGYLIYSDTIAAIKNNIKHK